MRRKKMLDAMELLDEEYVAEAAPKQKKPHRRAWITVAATAACFGIVLGSFGIYRLANRDTNDIEKYRDSEYYPLMQRLEGVPLSSKYALYSAADGNGGNGFFDKLFGGFGKKDAAPEAADPGDGDMLSGTADGTQSYEETTDNQVEGVIEGDIMKRSDRYIYYLQNRDALLRVCSIEGEASKEVGRFTVTPTLDGERGYIGYEWEMYLSEDCRTLFVIAQYDVLQKKDSPQRIETAVISLDVSDPSAIYEKGRVTITGEYQSSRMTDGKLYLINRFYVQGIEYDDPTTFVPQINVGQGMECLPMSKIVLPDQATVAAYTVISRIDEQSMALEDTLACLSYENDLYASRDSLYLIREHTKKNEDDTGMIQTYTSDILRVSYGKDTLTARGTVTLDGRIKDQYSLDEYKGILRVVTTLQSDGYIKETIKDQERLTYTSTKSTQNASLYAVDIESMQVVSSVERFAPEGETVRAVRFDGDQGYVCTAVQQTDPVFFFDLSDVHHITYKDTGTIPGFSTSLIQFGDGRLLGIGYDRSSVKIELYTEGENTVERADTFYVPGGSGIRYADDYKSYLIDRENGLFGFAFFKHGYIDFFLLQIKDDTIRFCAEARLGTKGAYLDRVRAAYVDGYLYAFCPDEFAVSAAPLEN